MGAPPAPSKPSPKKAGAKKADAKKGGGVIERFRSLGRSLGLEPPEEEIEESAPEAAAAPMDSFAEDIDGMADLDSLGIDDEAPEEYELDAKEDARDAPTGSAGGGVPGTASLPSALRGKVLLRVADRLIFEVRVLRPVTWAPGQTVWIQLADGRRVSVAVDTSGTTRDGDVHSGQVLRLVLTGGALAALTGPAVRIECSNGEVIELDA